MKLTRSDILAALAPIIAVVSGGVATWLLVHIHVLNVFVSSQSDLARVIASAVTFAVTSILVFLSAHVHWQPLAQMHENAEAVPVPPIKQILALIAPYVSVIAATIAAWLAVKVHVLATFHIDQTQVAQVVGAAVVFIVTAAMTWLAHHNIIKPTVVLR